MSNHFGKNEQHPRRRRFLALFALCSLLSAAALLIFWSLPAFSIFAT
jgi:hypothetical protein